MLQHQISNNGLRNRSTLTVYFFSSLMWSPQLNSQLRFLISRYYIFLPLRCGSAWKLLLLQLLSATLLLLLLLLPFYFFFCLSFQAAAWLSNIFFSLPPVWLLASLACVKRKGRYEKLMTWLSTPRLSKFRFLSFSLLSMAIVCSTMHGGKLYLYPLQLALLLHVCVVANQRILSIHAHT